jgi:molybdopterin-guanine dinucleotide biosynthesis protein A
MSRVVAAAIVAGGPARRLGGIAKPFINIGGRTVAERQLALLRSAFPRVLVVANDPAPWAELAVEVVGDRVLGGGPLSGIDAALTAAEGSDAVVCVAGDLPFLTPAMLAALRDRAPDADAVAPRGLAGRIEPLCARYGRALLPAIDARLRAGELAVHELLDGAAVAWLEGDELRALDPDGTCFLNLNTPDDILRAEAIAQQRP